MKHKHADLIREWALDTSRVVQAKRGVGEWVDVKDPTWGTALEYRFKPEPKPDYHTYGLAMNGSVQINYTSKSNLKLTFDGDTHQLKAAEVLK